jgi:hypothetical protein
MTSRLDKRRASCRRAARSSTAGRREDPSRLVYSYRSCASGNQAADEHAIAPIAALAAVAALVFFDLRETGQFGTDGVIFELGPGQ